MVPPEGGTSKSPGETGFEQASWGLDLLESETPLWRARNGVPDRVEIAGYLSHPSSCPPVDEGPRRHAGLRTRYISQRRESGTARLRALPSPKVLDPAYSSTPPR